MKGIIEVLTICLIALLMPGTASAQTYNILKGGKSKPKEVLAKKQTQPAKTIPPKSTSTPTPQTKSPSTAKQSKTTTSQKKETSIATKETHKIQTEVKESKPEVVKPKDDEIYVEVDQQAEFPGGLGFLMKWLGNNVHYPESAQQNNIQGRVIVKFVVEKDGSIGRIEIAKGVDKDLDREALRVVKKMPRWQPGKLNGVAVRSYFNLPVIFKLSSN